MILTGRDIQWYIQQGKLQITPVEDRQFQQNGIDLVLDVVDWPYGIYAGPMSFILGGTRELIEMPDDLMAFVELRSTWARRGFLLPPTIVDAGFKGNLTLEILCCKYEVIPIGEPFAHLIFAKTTGPCVSYAGKYQHQRGVTGPRDV